MTLWDRHKSTTVLSGLTMAESHWTMTNVLDDFQPAQCCKMLEKHVRVSSRAIGGQPLCLQYHATVIQDIPVYFVGEAQHKADCCKICIKAAD